MGGGVRQRRGLAESYYVAGLSAGSPGTKKASGSIGKTRRTLRSGFPSPASLSACSMEEVVSCARRVMAPSQTSTVTHIIFALLSSFAPSLSAGFARGASAQHVQRTPQDRKSVV